MWWRRSEVRSAKREGKSWEQPPEEGSARSGWTTASPLVAGADDATHVLRAREESASGRGYINDLCQRGSRQVKPTFNTTKQPDTRQRGLG